VNESNPAADHEDIGSRRVNFRRRTDWMDAFFDFPILRDRCPFDSRTLKGRADARPSGQDHEDQHTED
jgi:hypothetical protein